LREVHAGESGELALELDDDAAFQETKGRTISQLSLGKRDADYVFLELTRSICPQCRRVIDAKILLRENKVYMAKRCPQCGPFLMLVYGDAELYVNFPKYNKPGTIPLAFGSEIRDGCPLDCGCVRIISSMRARASSRSTARAPCSVRFASRPPVRSSV
jgi:hypothetical protein